MGKEQDKLNYIKNLILMISRRCFPVINKSRLRQYLFSKIGPGISGHSRRAVVYR